MISEISWSDSYLTDIEELDVQHRHIWKLLNALIRHANGFLPEADFETLSDTVITYIKWHFSCEESLMELTRYGRLDDHRIEHADLMALLTEKTEEFKTKKITITDYTEFISSWFAGHSFGYDKPLATFLKKRWLF